MTVVYFGSYIIHFMFEVQVYDVCILFKSGLGVAPLALESICILRSIETSYEDLRVFS